MAQVLPTGGGLTLTTPIVPSTETALHVPSLAINVDDHTGWLTYQILDAGGNVLSTNVIQLTAAQVNAIGAQVKTLIYTHLQALLGITGTVT